MGMDREGIDAQFRALEERLAMPSASESRESLAQLLAPEFREFWSSGRICETSSTLDALIPVGRGRVVLQDFKTTAVANGVVLVTYLERSVSGPGWKPAALRSSLWVRRGQRWELLFHQGTRLSSEEE